MTLIQQLGIEIKSQSIAGGKILMLIGFVRV